MKTNNIEYGDDWETVEIEVGTVSFHEMRRWLLDNICCTPRSELPTRLKYDYICAGLIWYMCITTSIDPPKQKWSIRFKNVDDATLFRLIWL